jgi:hypothetical protein
MAEMDFTQLQKIASHMRTTWLPNHMSNDCNTKKKAAAPGAAACLIFTTVKNSF